MKASEILALASSRQTPSAGRRLAAKLGKGGLTSQGLRRANLRSKYVCNAKPNKDQSDSRVTIWIGGRRQSCTSVKGVVQQLVGTLSHRCGRQPSVLQALQHCPLCCHATITWAPWPVMAEHESTQRLHACEVSQPPHGLNAINRDVFNTSIDMFFFPDRARAAAILPKGNPRFQQGHAQAIHIILDHLLMAPRWPIRGHTSLLWAFPYAVGL